MLEISIAQYQKYWYSIYNKDNLEKIMNIFNQHRIICALNKGIFGTTIINNLIELKMQECNMIKTTILNKNLSYIGKPIILTKNQKSLGLFNGDTGIMLPDKDNILKAFFVLKNKAIKIIPINLIQEYKTAWSMTIHKSQGSEFNHVTIILPNETSSIITRELIYTGITRSKKKITIFSLQKKLFKSY
ncbi:ATP-binding domain-containing protein [Buchnera aphidicola (Hormaphis cornu)]|nr:ATP-binding domain-containing protein [Buchnera aphidicola (Hormaphis cornu)]